MAANRRNDAHRRRMGAAAIALAAVGVLGMLFLTPLLEDIGFAIAALALVAAAVCGLIWRWYRQRDLDHHRLHLIASLIGLLQNDLHEDAPVSVAVKHGDCFRFGRVTSQRSAGNAFAGRVHYSEHEDAWLRLRGRLNDGTVLVVRACQEGKRKRKPKHRYVKVKDQTREKVTVLLRVRSETYPHLERLPSALDPQKLAAAESLHVTRADAHGSTVRVTAATGWRVQVRGRRGAEVSGKEHGLTARKLASMLVFVYSGLARCREGASA